MIKYILVNSFRQYKNSFHTSVLSYFWIFFQPLALIALYTLIFEYVMKARINLPYEHGYTLYIATALLPWIVISTMMQSGSMSILRNASYIRKINLPLNIFVAQDVMENAYNLVPVVLILWSFLFINGLSLSWLWIEAVIPLFLLVIATLGITIILAVLAVFIRDIEKIIGFVLQMMMWALPIVYPWDIIPKSWQWIVLYNPFFYYFNALRELLLYGHSISLKQWMVMILFSSMMLLIGLWFSRKAENTIRDIL